MKRILKTLGVLLAALCMLLLATACSDDGQVPDGMQTVRGGEEYGYYMYAPAEWTVANQGDIAAVYTSKIDNSSLTFVEADMPSMAMNDYFADEMAKLPFEITMKLVGERCTFGNAEEAYKYVFSYVYDERDICCMQILVKNAGDFYIFTFTSYNTERSEGESYYDFYLTEVQQVIDCFRFVEKVPTEPEAPEYERDGDGHLLVSDRTLSGFDMYVPEDWRVVDSSAFVSVSRESGENVNLTKATYTGLTRDEYWQYRRTQLEALVDRTAGEDGEEVTTLTLISEGAVERDDLDWAYYYEYEYKLLGRVYRVYQVLLVGGFDGFVFTYTAEDSLYEGSLATAKTILKKTKF